MMINAELLLGLIKLGKSDTCDLIVVSDATKDKLTIKELNNKNKEISVKISDYIGILEGYLHIDNEDFLMFIKGCAFVEMKISIGSASPISRFLKERRLQTLSPKLYEEIVNWLISNRSNLYIPFGVIRDGNSLQEVEENEKLKSNVKIKKSLIHQDKMAEQEKASKNKKIEKATINLSNALIRKDKVAVKSLLKKGADIHQKNQQNESALALAKRLGVESWLSDDLS